MKIWLVCFGVLFAIAELYEWVEHLTLPLPIYILGGAFLAIISNHNKRTSWPWQEPTAGSGPVIGSANNSPSLGNAAPQYPPQSISFTISRPGEPQE